jgi:hypothetical protein
MLSKVRKQQLLSYSGEQNAQSEQIKSRNHRSQSWRIVIKKYISTLDDRDELELLRAHNRVALVCKLSILLLCHNWYLKLEMKTEVD